MLQDQQQKQYDHDIISHDISHEGINTHVICHDSKEEKENRISKEDWQYLVDTLEDWRVYNPRAVVKKNPAAAWRCMNICKDRQVRVKGAYFTACFRTELARAEFKRELKKRIGAA